MSSTEDYGRLMKHLQHEIKKKAIKTSAGIIGEITALRGGRRYDVTTPDGAVYSACNSVVPKYKFRLNDWVAMEYTGTDWQIVGYSGKRASD